MSEAGRKKTAPRPGGAVRGAGRASEKFWGLQGTGEAYGSARAFREHCFEIPLAQEKDWQELSLPNDTDNCGVDEAPMGAEAGVGANGAPDIEIPLAQKSDGTRFWVGVVSASHVQHGVRGGFAQFCHGKAVPLRRMKTGDWLIYYSPRTEMGSGEPLQAFTAIGRVADDQVYEYAMSETFVPCRRNISYIPCKQARIADLLDRLNLTRGKRNWGYPFRTGHFEIDREDFRTIAEAMLADISREAEEPVRLGSE